MRGSLLFANSDALRVKAATVLQRWWRIKRKVRLRGRCAGTCTRLTHVAHAQVCQARRQGLRLVWQARELQRLTAEVQARARATAAAAPVSAAGSESTGRPPAVAVTALGLGDADEIQLQLFVAQLRSPPHIREVRWCLASPLVATVAAADGRALMAARSPRLRHCMLRCASSSGASCTATRRR
jgi:hypothetical protein